LFILLFSSLLFALPTPRFEVGSQEGLDYLNQKGYVVLKNVASPDDCKHATGLLWRFLEQLPYGIHKANIDTWEKFPYHGWDSTGIIPWDGIGQS